MSGPPSTAEARPPAPRLGSPPALPVPEALMARARHENFPVASRLLPRAQRTHLLALYGFARLVDEIGDELGGDRLAALDWLEAELDLAYLGRARHPLMRRLGSTLEGCGLPRAPFIRLIQANRQDQRKHSYATYAELEAYCDLSANPVGELVLHVFEAATPELVALSDRVCTGLQLAEHWQDVAEDSARGRVYIPTEDLERFGVAREELGARRAGVALRRLLAFEVQRARLLLDEGAPLIRALRGRPALAVAAFVGGGRAALEAIERAGCDVLAGSPRPSRAARGAAIARTLAGVSL